VGEDVTSLFPIVLYSANSVPGVVRLKKWVVNPDLVSDLQLIYAYLLRVFPKSGLRKETTDKHFGTQMKR
jgi:hypothetical protein